jgi:hypothetical protein
MPVSVVNGNFSTCQVNMLTNFPRVSCLRAENPAVRLVQRLTKKIQFLLRLFWGDPRFLLMSWLARFIAIREWVTQQGNYLSPAVIDATVIHAAEGACPLESPERVAQLIQTDGYYVGFSLKPSILRDLITFAETTPCYANRNPSLPFYSNSKDKIEQELGKPLLVAGYLNAHETCEAYQTIKHDPYLLAVASQYLNRPAVYLRGELAWSFPSPHTLVDKIKTARVYHCDINDFKTVKFFFYLTDVGEGDGPHVYMKGTHQTRQFGHQCTGQGCAAIADEDLVQTYGRDRVQVVTGKAGLGFVGDPYCLHKGTVPVDNSRLLLQLEFGIIPYRVWYF